MYGRNPEQRIRRFIPSPSPSSNNNNFHIIWNNDIPTNNEENKNIYIGPRANLQERDLYGEDLREAHLEGAGLTDAQLQGAFLQGAHLFNAHLEQVDLTEVTMGDEQRQQIEYSRTMWEYRQQHARMIERDPEYYTRQVQRMGQNSQIVDSRQQQPRINSSASANSGDNSVLRFS
jgi:hypothetical protein